MKTLFYNGTIYTGYAVIENGAVLTEDGIIKGMWPGPVGLASAAGADTAGSASATGVGTNPTEMAHTHDADIYIDLQGQALAPAFIDLQVYGGNGQFFTNHPSFSSIEATYQYCLSGGAAYFQPTMATQSDELMDLAIAAVADYQTKGGQGLIGLHLEGPYINPVKRGAHVLEYIQVPQKNKVAELITKAGKHLSMMTVAPERCTPEVIQQLLLAGVALSAGHSNATYEEALSGFAQGIRAATHLYNAMSPLNHRAPGLVGAILEKAIPYASIVVDGHHVDWAAIKIAKQLLKDKLFLITDSVVTNNEGVYQHQLEGDKYVLPDGTLSGSALTMIQAVQHCVEKVGISLEESLRMASLYPARVMGLENRLGSIEPGKEATLVWFDKDYRVKKVWVRQ